MKENGKEGGREVRSRRSEGLWDARRALEVTSDRGELNIDHKEYWEYELMNWKTATTTASNAEVY